MDSRKLSVVIPTYNRYEMTIESFAQVLDDQRVDEVVIVDDHSTDGSGGNLFLRFSNHPKVHLYINDVNQDCYRNKKVAIEYATNDYCILLDSDNIIDTSYLDAIYAQSWRPDLILTPEFAQPAFDFRDFRGETISIANQGKHLEILLKKPMFETMLNAANYFVNRKTYLDAFDPDIDPVTSDSLYMAYRLLANGNTIYVTEGLTYQHRIHPGSHYQQNIHKTPIGFHQSIIDKLATL